MVKGLAAAVVLMFAAGCSSGGSPAVPPTVTASPSIAVDAQASAACRQLALARSLHEKGKGEQPVDGYGVSTSEMQAMSAELKAQDLALKSTVPEVRQIALGTDSVPALRSWCEVHHL